MGPQSSLKTEFSWILTGNLFYSAMQYLMLIGMVKLTNPTLVGQFSFGLAVTAPIALFMSMAIRAVLISDSQNRFARNTYLKLRFLTAVGIVAAGILFVVLTQQPGILAKVIVLVALIKAFESISDIVYGFMQKFNQTHHIAKSLTIRGLLSCLLANLFLYLTGSIEWSCIGWLTATVLSLVLYDLPRLPKEHAPLDGADKAAIKSRSITSLFLLALPLGIATVLSSLESNVPRYFIEGAIGLSSLGVFSAISYPLMLTNQVVGSLASAPAPRLAYLFLKKDFVAFKLLLRQLILIALGLSSASALVCLFFGHFILQILNGPAYAVESQTFVILSLVTICNSVAIFFGAALYAMQCFYTKLILQAVSLVSVAAAAAIAASHKTLFAMAIALLIGTSISLAAQVIAFSIEYRRRTSSSL